MNFGPLEILILLLLWAVPSYFIARYAERKGHSFVVFLLIGLIVSWIISGIIALLVEDKVQPRQVVVTEAPGDHLDQLQKITELRDAGTLSADEFEAEKARILQGRPGE